MNFISRLAVDDFINAFEKLINQEIGLVRVFGEVSNATRATSGHWYFNLRGEKSLIRCVLFRNNANLSGLTPVEGMQIEVEAFVGIYSPRGELQLQIKLIRPYGETNAILAFEKLKQKLQSEGLFNQENKKAIPSHPNTVGVITSKSTAALQDVQKVLRENSPHIALWVYHASVQGANAPQELIDAIELAQKHAVVDVLLIVRGGGSVEDLSAFNDEKLIRKIAKLQIPIISGIGHESDTTLTDFVCDYRAATPTAAAHLLPKTAELSDNIERNKEKIINLMQKNLAHKNQQFDYAQRAIVNLRRGLFDKLQMQLKNYSDELLRNSNRYICNLRETTNQHTNNLVNLINFYLNQKKTELSNRQKILKAYNPESIQKKGYVLITHKNGGIVTSITQMKIGEEINASFIDGNLRAEVKKIILD